MRVFVSGIYRDSPEQNFQLKDGDLYVQFLWVPVGLSCEVGVIDYVGQQAVDGDLRMQHYVEQTAHRALLQMLIGDFKRVFGLGWAKALKRLVEREEAKEAEYDVHETFEAGNPTKEGK